LKIYVIFQLNDRNQEFNNIVYCKGFDETPENTDPRSTDHLTDPLTDPPAELTPYKINGKMKIKKPRTIIMEPDSSSSKTLAYLKLPRWRSRCRFPTPFSFD